MSSQDGSHVHNHAHHHDHGDVFHSHAPVGKMKTAFLLTLVILLAEVVGGVLSHSLALLADAGHVLTDIAAIGLSWFALQQAGKPSDQKMTYGYHRAGILAALMNGITLILITIWILWEAYGRIQHPEHVTPVWMFLSAGVGLLINLYLGLGMRHVEDINVKSAVLHMLGDAAASAGVIVGGMVMMVTGWYIVDPILSVLIALLIASGAGRILKQTVGILMEGTPKGVDFQKVIHSIKSVPGVHDVHDVHVWSITSGKNALSCHVVLDGEMSIRESQMILRDMEHRLVHLGISHATIQTEDGQHPHGNSELCAEKDGHLH
jgi:cobalt-zinc-cadmium efflux system protein